VLIPVLKFSLCLFTDLQFRGFAAFNTSQLSETIACEQALRDRKDSESSDGIVIFKTYFNNSGCIVEANVNFDP
jgi:hypothetical protein